jgi:hypothetical protein
MGLNTQSLASLVCAPKRREPQEEMHMPTTKPTPSWGDILPVHPAADLFPLMPPAELRALGKDIIKNGLQHDIMVWMDKSEKLFLLDGRNHLDAIGVVIKSGNAVAIANACKKILQLPTDCDPYAFVISANIHRRHLTTAQKRELIGKLLKAQPEKSDRQIAQTAKASHHTVGAVRADLEERGQIAHVATRTDSNGRQQPARKPPAADPVAAKAEAAAPEREAKASTNEIERLRSRCEELERENRRLERENFALRSQLSDDGLSIPEYLRRVLNA